MENNWSQSFRYWVLTLLIVLAGFLVVYLRGIFAPLIISALIAFILNPFVGYVSTRTKRSRGFVVGMIFIIGITILTVLPIVLIPPLVADMEIIIADLEQFLIQTQETISQPVLILGEEFSLEAILPDFTTLLSEGVSALPENALHFLETITTNLLWVLTMLVAIYYLLKDWNILRSWVFNQVPELYQPDARILYYKIRDVWHGYLMGNIAMMAIVGALFAIPWMAIGVPGGLGLGIITGVLTIIPDLGPAIAVALTALVALFEGSLFLDMSNGLFALLVTGIYLILVNVKNIWIRPLVFGRTLHMHEGLVFIIIMVAILVGGVMGALLAIPVVASASVLMSYIFRKLQGLPPWDEEEAEEAQEEPEEQDLALTEETIE